MSEGPFRSHERIPPPPEETLTRFFNTGLLQSTFEEGHSSFVSVTPHPLKFDKTISNGPEGVLSIFEGGLGVGQDQVADLSSVFCSVLVEHEL